MEKYVDSDVMQEIDRLSPNFKRSPDLISALKYFDNFGNIDKYLYEVMKDFVDSLIMDVEVDHRNNHILVDKITREQIDTLMIRPILLFKFNKKFKVMERTLTDLYKVDLYNVLVEELYHMNLRTTKLDEIVTAVTDYAVTRFEEDLPESFRKILLNNKNWRLIVRDQKCFFYHKKKEKFSNELNEVFERILIEVCTNSD